MKTKPQNVSILLPYLPPDSILIVIGLFEGSSCKSAMMSNTRLTGVSEVDIACILLGYGIGHLAAMNSPKAVFLVKP